jgi:hypothetical protein
MPSLFAKQNLQRKKLYDKIASELCQLNSNETIRSLKG